MSTIMSSKKGMRMIETSMAEREEMYSLMVSLLINLYCKSNPSSIFYQYSIIRTGVTKTTEIKMRKTHRITVLVVLITESFVKSSQIMSD